MKTTFFRLSKTTIILSSAIMCMPLYMSAQESENNNKEEGNRNVMLNAASANGPREIQIGLPSADVNVLENGLPVPLLLIPTVSTPTGVPTPATAMSVC